MPTDGRLPRIALVAGALVAVILALRLLPRDSRPPAGANRPAGAPALQAGRTPGAVVHVAGSVRRPGVYRLDAGARVRDAVRRAGGPRGSADLDALNLAARVEDGQQVLVPARGPSGASATGDAGGAPVNLGTATEAELDTLDGVGPVLARKIVAWRTRNGGIGSVEDLDAIPGIGPAKLEALRSQLGR